MICICNNITAHPCKFNEIGARCNQQCTGCVHGYARVERTAWCLRDALCSSNVFAQIWNSFTIHSFLFIYLAVHFFFCFCSGKLSSLDTDAATGLSGHNIILDTCWDASELAHFAGSNVLLGNVLVISSLPYPAYTVLPSPPPPRPPYLLQA